PANEYFDDECITDRHSSLGGFMLDAYPSGISQIQSLVREQLRECEGKDVTKEPGRFEKSYGIGTCVYLDRPLSSDRQIILVSVTTKRVGEGLRADLSGVTKAVEEVQRIVRDRRIASVYMPLLG